MGGCDIRPLIIIDAANVVGSRPDGWWRDRRAATERLRDHLAGLAARGLPTLGPPVDVVLVVEGQAASVTGSDTVSTDAAEGSGDDRIVELVAGSSPRPIVVVTADRGLRSRVSELGAQVRGPSVVYGSEKQERRGP